MLKRVYVNPGDPNAAAYRAALITHPGKYALAATPAESDVDAADLMPEGDQAAWATSYFVADAEIEADDLIGKTIEISIELTRNLNADSRLAEAMSVLSSLGISKLDGIAISRGVDSVGVAGVHRGSPVSVIHRTAPEAKLCISITDVKLRVVLIAPLGITAMAAEISGYSAEGTHTVRPLYRSTISRWLANH